jgi:Transglycosylase-like domain
LVRNHVRLPVLVAALALAVATVAPAHTADAASTRSTRSALIHKIDALRRTTWHWQQLMGKPRTPTHFAERRTPDVEYRRWVRNLWHRRALAAKRHATRPPHRAGWLCIHRYERHPHQGWATRTGNGYYGGLQMDISFQRTYGPELLHRKGTADNWTAIEQMWVAERAYRSGRGFYPWPNTARYCGLI